MDQSLRYHINILNAMETEGFEIVNREQQMAWADAMIWPKER